MTACFTIKSLGFVGAQGHGEVTEARRVSSLGSGRLGLSRAVSRSGSLDITPKLERGRNFDAKTAHLILVLT